jgi:energy-coupling factor transport system ATP-binding protein
MDRGRILYDDVPRAVFAHAQELEAIGLSAPQVTYILKELKEAGLDVDTTGITLAEAKETILEALHWKG